jgi:hypothetical protein
MLAYPPWERYRYRVTFEDLVQVIHQICLKHAGSSSASQRKSQELVEGHRKGHLQASSTGKPLHYVTRAPLSSAL